MKKKKKPKNDKQSAVLVSALALLTAIVNLLAALIELFNR